MNAPAQFLAASAGHPFPGLRPFAYQDHEYFFGRDDQTFALYRLIDRSRFVTVVGSSGSGKSSLVRAGLLPLLDMETGESGGRNWLWREMRPGDAPLQRLANLLASLSTDDDPVVASGRRERIAAQLQRSSFGISEALAETRGVTDKTLVMVVDQFEELFRYAAAGAARTSLTADDARARDEAAQFVQLLLEASRAPLLKINIVLTMRSDFIGDCARFHGLPEAVCAAQFLVPSLTRDQLDEVIRLPVEKAGATIDPELIERLLNDCGTELDQLPVLQHCLSRLWEEAGQSPVARAACAARQAGRRRRRRAGRPPPVADPLPQYRRVLRRPVAPRRRNPERPWPETWACGYPGVQRAVRTRQGGPRDPAGAAVFAACRGNRHRRGRRPAGARSVPCRRLFLHHASAFRRDMDRQGDAHRRRA